MVKICSPEWCAYKVLYPKNRENKVLRSKMGGIIVTPPCRPISVYSKPIIDISLLIAIAKQQFFYNKLLNPPAVQNSILRSAAFRCTVFKTRKDTATNTVRTIGQAFDVVHRITELEKEKCDENKNPEKQPPSVQSSPRKSVKSTKVFYFNNFEDIVRRNSANRIFMLLMN